MPLHAALFSLQSLALRVPIPTVESAEAWRGSSLAPAMCQDRGGQKVLQAFAGSHLADWTGLLQMEVSISERGGGLPAWAGLLQTPVAAGDASARILGSESPNAAALKAVGLSWSEQDDELIEAALKLPPLPPEIEGFEDNGLTIPNTAPSDPAEGREKPEQHFGQQHEQQQRQLQQQLPQQQQSQARQGLGASADAGSGVSLYSASTDEDPHREPSAPWQPDAMDEYVRSAVLAELRAGRSQLLTNLALDVGAREQPESLQPVIPEQANEAGRSEPPAVPVQTAGRMQWLQSLASDFVVRLGLTSQMTSPESLMQVSPEQAKEVGRSEPPAEPVQSTGRMRWLQSLASDLAARLGLTSPVPSSAVRSGEAGPPGPVAGLAQSGGRYEPQPFVTWSREEVAGQGSPVADRVATDASAGAQLVSSLGEDSAALAAAEAAAEAEAKEGEEATTTAEPDDNEDCGGDGQPSCGFLSRLLTFGYKHSEIEGFFIWTLIFILLTCGCCAVRMAISITQKLLTWGLVLIGLCVVLFFMT